MRYIIILEDGSIRSTDIVTYDLRQGFEEGLLDIIDCDTKTMYVGGFEETWEVPEPVNPL